MTAGNMPFQIALSEMAEQQHSQGKIMKQISLKRLETLEGKTINNEEQVQAVFFNIVDASKKAIEEKEPVQSWLFPPLVINRLPNETDDAFSDRAAIKARQNIKDPFAVPCLFSN